MIIQRTLAPLPSELYKAKSSKSVHGYLLLMPKGWSMPFLESIIHTGTRVGGLREHGSQRYEAGVPRFPEDYVTTTACVAHWNDRAAIEQAKWLRTPSAKRPPYHAMPASGVAEQMVWLPDWKGVLKLERKSYSSTIRGKGLAPGLVPTPLEDGESLLDSASKGDICTPLAASLAGTPSETDYDSNLPYLIPWLLHGPKLGNLLKSLVASPDAQDLLLKHINGLRARAHLPLYPMTSGRTLLCGTLAMVNLRMCGRGNPEDLSVIYSLPEDFKFSRDRPEDVPESQNAVIGPSRRIEVRL